MLFTRTPPQKTSLILSPQALFLGQNKNDLLHYLLSLFSRLYTSKDLGGKTISFGTAL